MAVRQKLCERKVLLLPSRIIPVQISIDEVSAIKPDDAGRRRTKSSHVLLLQALRSIEKTNETTSTTTNLKVIGFA